MKSAGDSALPKFLRRLLAQIRARSDSEFQQTLIRVVIACLFYLYFVSDWQPHEDAIVPYIHPLGIGFLLISISLLVGTLIDTGISPPRRFTGMAADFLMITSVLFLTGESGAPLVSIYLWVTLGNGFRYGVRYLLASLVLSVLSFGFVIATNPFWQGHLALSLGFLLTLVAVPLYAISLMRQLHNATSRAIEASQAKSTFLANMSHELRTPLNGIIGVSDLLAETRLDKEQKEFAQIIHSSAHTLLELIDKVLDISRIEAGQLASHQEDFDLHRLVNGTIAMLEMQAQKKGLTLAAHIAPQTPFQLHGDARHLRQILINLIGNALKFTEHGRVDVYIRPMGQGNPQRLRFEVVDTGIGIAEAAQARIFDSFTQADSSITRRYGGTGLGTAIAKQLVEALKGQIGLHSREGEGTTFWFEIPFAIQAGNSEAESHDQFEEPMRVAILAGAELAARMQTLVRSWGAEAVVVSNTTRLAAELSAYLAGGAPMGAVIVERNALPGNPGEFLRLLHDDPSLAALPVILIESAPDANRQQQANWLREGFASVLATPVNSTLLFNAIHAAVSQGLPQNVVSLADHFQSQSGQMARMRILVAEDNPVNQRVIRGLLEHAGHEAYLAHDGEEALAMLESGNIPYDLAIIDMHMPQLSGPEVVQRWRFMESGHLPIIMLTADARDEAQRACEEAGADTFLTKPVGSRELIDVIARLAKHAGHTPSVAVKATAASQSVLDESILEDLLQLGGQPFIRDLVRSFAEDSRRAILETERALITQDYGLWHDQLHMLKGGASDVGAFRLAQLCVEAENIKPFEITTETARVRLDVVRAGLDEAQAALTTYLDRKQSVQQS